MSSSTAAMATTLGLSKVFILDKYFSELQKFWETEKRLQGMEEKSYFSETGSNIAYRLIACGIHIHLKVLSALAPALAAYHYVFEYL